MVWNLSKLYYLMVYLVTVTSSYPIQIPHHLSYHLLIAHGTSSLPFVFVFDTPTRLGHCHLDSTSPSMEPTLWSTPLYPLATRSWAPCTALLATHRTKHYSVNVASWIFFVTSFLMKPFDSIQITSLNRFSFISNTTATLFTSTSCSCHRLKKLEE